MALGTLERSAPPFFRQGLAPRARLAICAGMAVLLMLADARWKLVEPVRGALATALHPVQRALAAPLEAAARLAQGFAGLEQALQRESQVRVQLAAQSVQAARAAQLERENAQLRALLELRPGLAARSQAAELLYEVADPYARRVVIDRGAGQGVLPGAPVVNDSGVLGQVTRVHAQHSEATLLSDGRASIPVLNARTRARAVAFGGASPHGMELRFVASNADVQVGDVLVTSGLDGVYPPGLPVARVMAVDRLGGSGFAGIALAPLAQADGVRHVLVLEPVSVQLPVPPASAASAPAAAPVRPPARAASRPGQRAPNPSQAPR
jgi:rod shape-determining protein MreC